MLLSPVTALGRGLEGVSSLPPPSVAHPVRAASRIFGRFLTIASRDVEGWGWGVGGMRPGGQALHLRTAGAVWTSVPLSGLLSLVRLSGRLVQLSGWPCLVTKKMQGNWGHSQQTVGSQRFSTLLGALRVSPHLPPGHRPPSPSSF